MKKLLIIAGQKSYPATDGGKISILYSMLEFARHFDVYHCFITEKPLTSGEKEFFAKNNVTIFPVAKSTADSSLGLLKNIVEVEPFKMKKYFSKAMLEVLFDIVKTYKIDFAWVVQAHLGSYGLALKAKFNIPVYLREQNIEYELVRQFGIHHKNIIYKLIAKWQYHKTKKHEIHLWNKLDKSFFISDLDYNQAKPFIASPEKAVILYDSFAKTDKVGETIKEEKSLLFSGSLKSIQNVINLEDFLENVMSKLVEKDNRWKLYVTANRELDISNHLKSKNVINAGFVPDIDSYTKGKKYLISPTLIGSGVRIKVLNAMALGMVCFVSELDYATMDYFKDMENIVKYSNFQDFYEKLGHLENNDADYQTISINALKIHQELTWGNYVQKVIASIN